MREPGIGSHTASERPIVTTTPRRSSSSVSSRSARASAQCKHDRLITPTGDLAALARRCDRRPREHGGRRGARVRAEPDDVELLAAFDVIRLGPYAGTTTA